MNDGPNATWLPNLVGGVSIWKLAVDLNEAKFFDGRLLVPETEGSESLPVTVRWDLTGLLPLREARARHPAQVEAAIGDFQDALGRVAKVFATPDSGYDKYKAAFTVPSVEAEEGANYFYCPERKKLFVINWGASPRSMAGRAEYVFGYEDWGRTFKDGSGSSGAVAGGAAAGALTGAEGGAAAVAEGAAAKQEEAEGAKQDKNDGKKRPWWVWPLFGLIAIILILLALFLLKACEEPGAATNASGSEAGAEAGVDGASDGAAAADGAEEAGGDAAGVADAAVGLADGGDAGADAAGEDAGKDAGKDGAAASNDDDDDDGELVLGPDGKPVPGGKVIITMGGAGGGGAAAKTGPHRRHFQSEAVKWRISSGNDKVSRTEASGHKFDVWLGPGRTFQGVGVEWQDKAGKWHVH